MKDWYTRIITFAKSKKAVPVIDVLLFVIITYAVHKLWWHFSAEIYDLPGFLNITGWLAREVYQVSAWININILRMDIKLAEGNTMIFLKNSYFIYINESCSGFKQMVQIVILFILFPGPWKQKLWFIPACIVAMFLVNVLRVIGLSYAMMWSPANWDFIHLWVMRPFYYVAIFFMWVIWVEKFKNKRVGRVGNV
jgi:exosortase/archaeosortase family protein